MLNKVVKDYEDQKKINVWNGELDVQVRIAGSGPAVIYLHPAGPLYWDEFLDRLAENHTVYAPLLPGTTPGDPYAIYKVDSYEELILIYEEVIRKLDLERSVLIGQSMGGMIAGDLAAAYPSMFSRLIMFAPTGLWREEAPVAISDLYRASPDELPGYLFHDPGSPAARAMMALPEDHEQIPGAVAYFTWALGCSAKFLWPIPERGLKRRLHRISVPTLILWGQQDRVVPVNYAKDFKAGIDDCKVVVFDDCGHVVQVDKLHETITEVMGFIA